MIVFGVLAEFSRIGYYPIIVFGALCFLTEPAFMLWGETVSVMQVRERRNGGRGEKEGMGEWGRERKVVREIGGGKEGWEREGGECFLFFFLIFLFFFFILVV